MPRGPKRKPRGRARAAMRVLSSNHSFGSIHSTYAKKDEVDGPGPENDAQPGRAQIRPDDARELGIERAPLDELLVPAVLKRVRQTVGEEERDVDREPGPLPSPRHAGRNAGEQERTEGEEDPVQPVVVSQVDGVQRRLAAERRLDLLRDERVADERGVVDVEAELGPDPGKRGEDEHDGDDDPCVVPAVEGLRVAKTAAPE